jgi:murein DD-endopeptidase MepM/ murein hydrolase activator NlpD
MRARVWHDRRVPRLGLPVLCLIALVACKEETPADGAANATASASDSAAAASEGATVSATHAPASASAKPKAAPRADPSRLKLKGRAVQGALMHAKVDKGTKGIKFPGHRVIISDEGEFLIAFYRNAPKEEKLTVSFPDGSELDHLFEVEQRSYEVDRIDGLPKHWVELDPVTRKKLHDANGRIEQVRKKYSKKDCYNEGFQWPSRGRITSRYGQPRVLNGIDSGIHWGVDIAAVVGTAVRAPACGTVTFVEANVPLSGHMLILDHGRGLSSSFLHLGSFAVKVGDEVKQGDMIGTVGMTGRTNGAHLDWRMNLFETRIDPELLAPPME